MVEPKDGKESDVWFLHQRENRVNDKGGGPLNERGAGIGYSRV